MSIIHSFNDSVIAKLNASKRVSHNNYALMRDVANVGPYWAVKNLIAREMGNDIPNAVASLVISGKSDLLLETLVIRPEYSELFTREEVEFCRELVGAA